MRDRSRSRDRHPGRIKNSRDHARRQRREDYEKRRQRSFDQQKHRYEDHRRKNKQGHNNQHQRIEKENQSIQYKVNRKSSCPFLVRVFYEINGQNMFNEEKLPQKQLHLHLWMDSTLRQITEILRAYMPQIRTKQKFVYRKLRLNEEKKETYKQEIGVVTVHRKFEKAEEKSLYACKFTVGDHLDISINYK